MTTTPDHPQALVPVHGELAGHMAVARYYGGGGGGDAIIIGSRTERRC